MKYLLTILILILSLVSCQETTKKTDEFAHIKDFFYEKSLNIKPGESELTYDPNTKSMQLNGVDIPLLKSSFRYTAIKGENMLSIECSKCISYEKDGELKVISGLAFPFESREDCLKLVDMLEEFKATHQAN